MIANFFNQQKQNIAKRPSLGYSKAFIWSAKNFQEIGSTMKVEYEVSLNCVAILLFFHDKPLEHLKLAFLKHQKGVFLTIHIMHVHGLWHFTNG